MKILAVYFAVFPLGVLHAIAWYSTLPQISIFYLHKILKYKMRNKLYGDMRYVSCELW